MSATTPPNVRPSPPPSGFVPTAFDRLPPHSVESEMCVLASAMLDREVCGELVGMLSRHDFFQADHQIIFDMIAARQRGGKPVDGMLVREDLVSRQLLDEVGGVSYLSQILTSVPSAAHGAHYALKVIETARLRAAISTANDLTRDAYSPLAAEEWEVIVRRGADNLLSVLNHGTTETIRHIRDVVMEDLERKTNEQPKRIPTGLAEFDKITGGVARGRMTVIGGKPGMGKSLVAKQIVYNAAKAGITAGIVAIEEDRFKIADNYLSSASGVPNNRIAYEKCDAVEWAKVMAVVPEFSNLPIYVDDQQTTISGVLNAVSRLAVKYGCQLIVIDYLQLISPDDNTSKWAKSSSREQEVSKLSNSLKMAFKRLNVAGVVTAQLNRGSGTERPQLHHLRESGAIEQDGDLIALLYREDYYRCKEVGFVANNLIEVDFAKNKDGPLGMVPLTFDGRTQSVYDVQGPVDPF